MWKGGDKGETFPKTTIAFTFIYVREEQAGGFKDCSSMPKLVGNSFIEMRIPREK